MGNEIPKFDLAEEIMAEQRKITAVRRKAPGEKKEAQSQEVGAERAQSYEEQIIAEIVARDIERLYRGGNMADSG